MSVKNGMRPVHPGEILCGELETEEGIFLYSKKKNKLSWKEIYCAMAADREDWSDLDITVADGLD
ncbi:MAG: hypothetical protein F4Z85_15150 [Gemmatimonadetes bacterium]|nr:hypothetical protein [Gemmatimonadota bacterium]MYB72062.1 hypothetical protein [Gemmatimonadota bacterium]